MKGLKTITFYVFSLLAVAVLFAVLFRSFSNLGEPQPQSTAGETTIGAEAPAAISEIYWDNFEIMPENSDDVDFTSAPLRLDSDNKHIILADTVYDAVCLDQTWPQACEVASLPTAAVTMGGMIYNADCLAVTWPQDCIVRVPVNRSLP